MTFTSSTNKTAKNYKYPTRCGFACSLKVPWVPGACSCIHTQNQRNLYRWIRIPDGQMLPVAGLYIVGAGLLLLHHDSHTESAQSLLLVSEFLTVRRFLVLGCTPWVPGACSCIHTQNQRNLYRWDLNSWRLPDAPCYRAAHRIMKNF